MKLKIFEVHYADSIIEFAFNFQLSFLLHYTFG